MHGTSPAEVPIPVTGIGGLVTLANPDSLPIGASPRNYDWDYLVGGGQTRPGLTNVYLQVDAEVGPRSPGAAASSTWNVPNNILAGDGSYTSFAPANAPNYIDVTDFSFSLPATDNPTGVILAVKGFSNVPANLTAQLLIAGVPSGNVKTLPLPQTVGTITFGASNDMWGLIITQPQVNALNWGVRLSLESSGFTGATGFLDYVSATLGVSTGTSNFQYIGTFADQKGTVRNISVDANGNLWVENVSSAPGAITLARTGISLNALVSGSQGAGVQYLAFGDGFKGIDMPLQYTPNWIDRVTQVGPGMAPVFTPITSSSTNYQIASITQPAKATDPFGNLFYGGIYYLQSSGPGSSQPGNVVTVYYGDIQAGCPENADLLAAWNDSQSGGPPVYLYLSITGTPTTFGPETIQVTGIGRQVPPGQASDRPFYYLTFVVPSVAYFYYAGSGHPSYEVAWQRTMATLTTTVPVPGVQVGSQITVSGCTPVAWNAAWRVVETPNASQMAITGSQVSSGVATFNYAVTGAAPAPAAGELVTITNTLNAGGQLNVASATIISVSGSSTGTFTINVSIGNFEFEAEDGLATTAGTIFEFDPGAALVGTPTNPIYGNTTVQGTLVFNSSGLFIDPGTYQGTAGFITRNGLWTFPAPPVVFTVPNNTTGIQVTGLLTGPEDVVGRYISITEAGQNGVPGGNFFVLPTPVQFYSQDIKYTATATAVNDNSSTSVNLFFTGSILNNALAIDRYGYNLFNCIEVGNPGWMISYGGRQWYGLCLNKVQNFVNLSFDGGPPSGQPPGWTSPDAFGKVVPSPKFGNAYYISNNGLTLAIVGTSATGGVGTYTYVTSAGNAPGVGDPVTVTGTTNGSGAFNVTNAAITGVNTGAGTFTIALAGSFTFAAEAGVGTVTGTLPVAGLIQQTAFQNAYQNPIIEPNTTYSVQVTASNPSGNQNGTLVIALVSAGVTLGSFTLPFSSLTTDLKIYTGTLLTAGLVTVPPGAVLQVSATNLGSGADVQVDRIDIYPTEIPVLTTTVFGSYAGLPEQVDAVTGAVGFSSENQQPVNGAMVLYDTFYGLKAWAGKTPGSSLYSLQKASDLEPAQWDEPEVAQRSGGAIGPLAFDLGEQWFLGASRNGLYLFVGGQPGKISQEIFQVWDAINWAAAQTMWVKVDLDARRIYIGVPMSTPNFWLPNVATVTNPTSPNVILMCDFKGLDSGEELRQYPQMHTTMFGTLNAIDMRRKWSIWQIPAPYANLVQGPSDVEFYICNGRGNSKVYQLDPNATTDDGIVIDSLYTTAGLPGLAKRVEMPQLGKNRVRATALVATLESAGNIQMTLYGNRLPGPNNPPASWQVWKVPGGISPGKPYDDDAEVPALNFAATRIFFELRQNDGLGGFSLSNFVPFMKKDQWNAMRGRTGA